jgi:hypothetical protein
MTYVHNKFNFEEHMKWLKDNDLIYVMDGFKEFYGMSSIHGAIDVIEFQVQKLKA